MPQEMSKCDLNSFLSLKSEDQKRMKQSKSPILKLIKTILLIQGRLPITIHMVQARRARVARELSI